jgi:hypothetical protein
MPAVVPVEVLTVEELGSAIRKHFRPELRSLASGGMFPDAPGVYVWSSANRVLYIGMARSLAVRLGEEQEWLDAFDPALEWHYSVIHLLKVHAATVGWIVTKDEADAAILERRLIEWHRACVGIAPLAVGWESRENDKPHSRFSGELWARELWHEEFSE